MRELDEAKRRRAARRDLDRAKALMRAHPGSGASVEGEEPSPRYSQEQLARLYREGKALRLRNGTYGWGCADRRDLPNCIAAWNRGEAKSQASEVKAFLKRRAVLLRLESLLPSRWKAAMPKPLAGGVPSAGSMVGGLP